MLTCGSDASVTVDIVFVGISSVINEAESGIVATIALEESELEEILIIRLKQGSK